MPNFAFAVVCGALVCNSAASARPIEPPPEGSCLFCIEGLPCPCDQEPATCEGLVGTGSDKSASDPVHLFNGEFYERRTDLVVEMRGFTYAFERTYRSKTGEYDVARNETSPSILERMPIGRNWDHSYNISVQLKQLPTNPPTDLLVFRDGHGRRDLFTGGSMSQPNSAFTNPQYFADFSVQSGQTLVMNRPDGTAYWFRPLNAQIAPGKLDQIVDRNGNSLTFDYDSLGRLAMVSDTVGRSVSFFYASNGTNPYAIQSIVDDQTGRVVQYEYFDAENPEHVGNQYDLVAVTLPTMTQADGSTTTRRWRYTYQEASGSSAFEENVTSNLLTITDPNGYVVLCNTYASNADRVVTQRFGTDYYEYNYGGESDEAGTQYVTTVINRAGRKKVFYFDGGRRLIRRDDWTRTEPWGSSSGSCTPPGRGSITGPVRPGDADRYVQRRSFNPNNSLLGMTYWGAQIQSGPAMTYTYDNSNPVPQKRGNRLSAKRTPASGLGDSPIVETWTYDFDLSGSGGCGCGQASFATLHVDGRGTKSYSRFDSRGNLLRRFVDLGAAQDIPPNGNTHDVNPNPNEDVIESWTYDATGRVVAHTPPPNNHAARVDGIGYFSDTIGAGSGQPQHLGQVGRVWKDIVDQGRLNLTTQYDYDLAGNVVYIRDPNGNVTRREYNEADQVSWEQREASDGTILSKVWRYYDANLNLLREDVSNRNQFGAINSTEPAYSTLHAYDINNRLTLTCEQVSGSALATSVRSAEVVVADSRFIATGYEYDANDNLVKIIKGQAVASAQPENVIYREYDERDLLYRETIGYGSPQASVTQHNYDARRQLVDTYSGFAPGGNFADGARMHYEYDGHARLNRVTDPMGNATTFAYDNNDNRTNMKVEGKLVDGAGGTSNVRLSQAATEYDPLNRPTVVTRYWFNPATQAAIGGGSSVTHTEYYPDSSVHTTKDARTNETLYEYDTASRLERITDPGQNTTLFSRDANGNILTQTVTERNLSLSLAQPFQLTYTYDALDRERTRVDNRGNSTEMRYDSRGNVVTTFDARGNRVDHVYDGLSRLTSTTRTMTLDGTGSGTVLSDQAITTSQVWDRSSRLVQQIDDNSNITAYTYDPLDRVEGITYGDGTKDIVNEFDRRGNPIRFTDARGWHVTSGYDTNDRVTCRDVMYDGDPTNSTFASTCGTPEESYAYDGLSRLISAADEDSVVLRTYDSLSNLVTESLALSPSLTTFAVTQYAYDASGNITQIQYPGGRLINRAIDAGFDRVWKITSNEGGDQNGRLAEFTYVGPSRVLRRDLGNGLSTLYGYDGLMGVTPPDTSSFGLGLPRVIDHVRLDSNGAVQERVTKRVIRWDRSQNKTRVGRYQGVDGSSQAEFEQRRWDYTYDSVDRLHNTRIDDTPTNQQDELTRDETYTLDGVHNRNEVAGIGVAMPGTYDMEEGEPFKDREVNQYTQFNPEKGDPEEIRYDASGNLIDWSPHCAGDTNLDHSVNGLDLSSILALFGQTVPPGTGADLNGDLVVNGADLQVLLAHFGAFCSYKHTTYDYRNQMTAFESRSDTSVAYERHEYHYDTLGRRVRKVTTANDSSLKKSLVFINGGEASWQLLEERNGLDVGGSLNGVSGSVVATYVYSGGYIDDVVSTRRDPQAAGAFDPPLDDYYFHADDLFSTLALTDGDGAVVERCDYEDYGQVTFTDADGNPTHAVDRSDYGNRLTFTGREHDPESKLFHFRTRYLRSDLGRFLTRDTIGVWSDDLNVGSAVAYVGEQPIALSDPFGEYHYDGLSPGDRFFPGHGLVPAQLPAPTERRPSLLDPDTVVPAIDIIAPWVPGLGLPWDIKDLCGAIYEGDGVAIACCVAAFVPGGDALKTVRKVDKAVDRLKPVRRGMAHPTVKRKVEDGIQRHGTFDKKVKSKPGWQSKPRIRDPENPGKYYVPDAIDPKGRPIELKPRTPSGIRRGKSQMKQYERVTGRPGRILYY